MLLTVYGRLPVLEALTDERVAVEGVLLDRTAKGESVDAIVAAAARRGVPVRRVTAEKVTRVSGNGRHDQGVVADVDAPGVVELDAWLGARPAPTPVALVVLDGVTNPANVGMVVRAVAGAGLDGVVLPRAGSPDVGPLVIKASAGVAFRSTVLRCATPASGCEALLAAGLELVGLRGDAVDSVFEATFPERVALVLGNETTGVSAPVSSSIGRWLSIPLADGVESLNLAVAAGIAAYQVARGRQAS